MHALMCMRTHENICVNMRIILLKTISHSKHIHAYINTNIHARKILLKTIAHIKDLHTYLNTTRHTFNIHASIHPNTHTHTHTHTQNPSPTRPPHHAHQVPPSHQWLHASMRRHNSPPVTRHMDPPQTPQISALHSSKASCRYLAGILSRLPLPRRRCLTDQARQHMRTTIPSC